MNIAEILNGYLLENVLEEGCVIYNDVFPDSEGDCIISRHSPSQATEKVYIDGTAVGNVSLSYFMRSRDAGKCRNVLGGIISVTDGLRMTADGIEVKFEAVTVPNFVSVDDKNNAVYTCDITARYERKRGR